MKRCPECQGIYEVYLDICPTCGEPLRSCNRTTPSRGSIGNGGDDHAFSSGAGISQPSPSPDSNRPGKFMEIEGKNVLINGAVVESNTQQYYQSKLTRFFNAVFSGEPYQFSHTTFVTIFRVEESTIGRYPEHAMDVTLYGNMQNLFAVGDDLTITGRRKGSGVVAKSIFNHSISSPIRMQPYIPAGVVRGFVLFVAATALYVIYGILTADYLAIFDSLLNRLLGMLPLGLLVIIGWYLLKAFFRKG